MNFPRTLVIGIDGATFTLLKPWAEAGVLPTFAHLLKYGAHAPLNAYPYMNSAAAWTNLVTGYNPAQHGIYNFIYPGKTPGAWRPITGADRAKPAFWHLLSEGGQRVGVMNVPISYPAEPINGFMVSGMDSPDTTIGGFTYPKGLNLELGRAGIHYVIDVANMGQASRQGVSALPSSVRDMTIARTRAFLYLLEKYPCDAAMLVYIGADRMSHYFWRDTPPAVDAPEWRPLRELFQLYDAQLDELFQHAARDTTVFIVSDHGFGLLRRAFYGINPLLRQLGYQAARAPHARARWLGSLLRLGRRTIPQQWQRPLAMRFPRAHARATRSDRLAQYDWSRTRAYAEIGASIRINSTRHAEHGIVDEAGYDALWAELADVLSAVTDPDSGLPLVTQVHRGSSFYRGPYEQMAPDLLGEWNRANMRDALAYLRDGQSIVIRPPSPFNEWTGTHFPEGVFIAYGKGIRGGVAHSPVNHFGLTPTILYLHDLPVAEDMDGEVLTDWLEPSFVAGRPVRRKAAEDYRSPASPLEDKGNELVEQRLRQLGYIE
jgi:predicted AlkP superfamily phosphohydrolase/phosphomutase